MSSSQTDVKFPWWLPSPLTIFVVVLGALLFGAVLAKGPWDSDYFWHVTTGELIATSGLPGTDPYSFTWGGRPWVLHEWLSEILLYRLVDALGYIGTVVVFALLPGLTFAILAIGLRQPGMRTSAIAIATTLGALVLVPYMTLRPQVISWVFFAILMVAFLHLNHERRRLTLLAMPFFALWANVHGLWAVGLGILGLYLVLTFLRLTPLASSRRWATAGFAVAVLGTAFTPSGVEGMLYPLRYVEGGDWGLANITEWQSPDFHEPAHLPLLVFMVAVAFFGRQRVPGWLTVFAYVGIAMALLALRNAPIAAILGVPAVAYGVNGFLDSWRPTRPVRSAKLALQRRITELVAAAVIIAAGLFMLVPADPAGAVAANVELNHPVQSVDLLLEIKPEARVAAEYGWGGYVIGRMYSTGGTVMVDGRNDMYDQSILEEYGLIREAEPGWIDVVEKYDVEALLFPPEKAITKGPAAEAGWCEAFRDENEVLFLRSCP